MPSIVVRPYEEKDKDAFFHVRSVTYENARQIPEERKVLNNVRGFLAETDGEVAGTYVVLDLTATRGPALLKTGGIAAVAVLPQHRRSGVGSEMMRWALGNLRSDGFQLASLYAFREPFYRRVGYEVCGGRYKITVPSGRFPKTGPTLPIRTIPASDLQEILPAYEMFARARSGMNLRTSWHWERVLGTTDESLVYVAGDPVEAYAIVKHKWEFWEEQPIREFVWITERGYDSILQLFASIGINKTGISWHEPTDSPFLQRHIDQGIQIALDRPIMFRALDVPSCLRQLKPQASGEFCLSVDDPEIPENRGPWRVQLCPDRVSVERCEEADLTLGIGQFTQALLGQPSLEDLVRNGSVRVAQAAAFSAARALFSPSPVYCTDFF